ncbi:MAG: Uma2 family endonuclease [Deltaproteobacteria bacterium]|nr:Uma2 family endonuclease [Deltaproteobacteria bacterium]
MAQAQKIKFSYEDYLLMPEDKRYELIDGDLLMTPSPSWKHQTAISRLFEKINKFVRSKKMGEVRFAPLDVFLSPEDVVQPDLLFLSKDRLKQVTERNIQGAPDLVVEVLSPGTEQRDRLVKRKLYSRFGVKEYWIVDPERKNIEVITWEGSDFKTFQVFPENALFKSPLMEGLSFHIKEIFE